MMNDCAVRTHEKGCGGNDAVFCADVPLAMAYVRDQKWECPMNARDALNHGTAFKRLVKPFRGGEGCKDEQ